MKMLRQLVSSVVVSVAALGASLAHAQTAPDAMVKQLANQVIDDVKNDKAIQGGDVGKIRQLVDAQVAPHVDFPRMTASVVGRAWKTATPDQQKKLQDEFKTLLIRTYAGALTQVTPSTTVEIKPLRASPDDTEVVVRTLVKGKGDPVQLDYRLEKVGTDWKIFDVNVLGVWLVDQYKNGFAQQIAAGGIDGLIKMLVDKNSAAPSK
jgi:phospholipid transport system substrate-binding protein